MLTPALHSCWKHWLRTQRAPDSACWLGPDALVAVKVLLPDHLLAVGMIVVVVRILALFNQVLVHLLDLDDLVTLPTRRQHWTLLPIMNVDGLTVEARIVSAAKVACLLFWRLLLVHGLYLCLMLLLLLKWWLLDWCLFLSCACGALCTLRVNICADVYDFLVLWLFLLVLWRNFSFNECSFNLLYLCRPQFTEAIPDFFTHRPV